MVKVLLVEDNKEISDNIKEYLELEDFQVTVCDRGDDGLDTALSKKFDIILLDVMLPGIDGFRVAYKVTNKIDTPIIMITAKDAVDDKLEGFKQGVVDYIVKPFDLRELEARINAVLLRNTTGQDLFEIGDITINLKNRVFLNKGVDVKITQKEFLILEYLLNRSPEAVSRSELVDEIWGEKALFESDGKLDVYISTIRNKLSKDLIRTIKGFGYKIVK